MKARDLQKAFSAVSPDFRKEAREIAGTKQKHSGRRRIVLKIAAGLTAAAAVFGGLLFAGVWLANNDGVNVQKVNYPVEVVTGAGTAGTSTVTDGTGCGTGELNAEDMINRNTDYKLSIENPDELTVGVQDLSFSYAIEPDANYQYTVGFSAPEDHALLYTFSTVPSRGTLKAFVKVKTVCNDPLKADSIAKMLFPSNPDPASPPATLRVTVEAGQTYWLCLKVTEPETTGIMYYTVTELMQQAEVQTSLPTDVSASATTATTAVTQLPDTGYVNGTTDEPIITTRWVGGTRVMQLDDVRKLAKKGMSLKWADFEPYHGLGSNPNDGGMRIQTYNVGEYTLSVCGWYSVGGAVYDPEIDSAVLYTTEDKVKAMAIDIRTGDLEQFLIDCQNYYLTTTMPTTTSATTTTTTTLPAPQRPNLQDGTLYRWIDCGEFTENSPFNLVKTLVMPDAPDLEFVFWKGEGIEVRRGDTVVAAVGGMPLWKVYFADINGDGYFDMITDAGMGSGRYWKEVHVYDYHNDRFYNFAAEDSLQWDYALDVREIYSYGTYELCLRRYHTDMLPITEHSDDYTLGRMVLAGDTLTFAPFEIND